MKKLIIISFILIFIFEQTGFSEPTSDNLAPMSGEFLKNGNLIDKYYEMFKKGEIETGEFLKILKKNPPEQILKIFNRLLSDILINNEYIPINLYSIYSFIGQEIPGIIEKSDIEEIKRCVKLTDKFNEYSAAIIDEITIGQHLEHSAYWFNPKIGSDSDNFDFENGVYKPKKSITMGEWISRMQNKTKFSNEDIEKLNISVPDWRTIKAFWSTWNDIRLTFFKSSKGKPIPGMGVFENISWVMKSAILTIIGVAFILVSIVLLIKEFIIFISFAFGKRLHHLTGFYIYSSIFNIKGIDSSKLNNFEIVAYIEGQDPETGENIAPCIILRNINKPDEAIVLYPGTALLNVKDWLDDMKYGQIPIKNIKISGKILLGHQGVVEQTERTYEKAFEILKKINPKKICCIGHSQGAGQAQVMGVLLLNDLPDAKINFQPFASLKVFNPVIHEFLGSKKDNLDNILLVQNYLDIVPRLPLKKMFEQIFTFIGTRIVLDSFRFDILKNEFEKNNNLFKKINAALKMFLYINIKLLSIPHAPSQYLKNLNEFKKYITLTTPVIIHSIKQAA